jgi:large subunit ribosomal protein L9
VEAQTEAEKINGLTVQIAQKAGVDGKLFGSVTNADIVAALAVQGFTVEKSHVRMPEGHLKQVGDYPISIGLHSDVVAHITVSVLGEH